MAYQFALARYHPNGRLDTSFGRDGKVPIDFRAAANEQVKTMVIDGLDRIIVGGYAEV